MNKRSEELARILPQSDNLVSNINKLCISTFYFISALLRESIKNNINCNVNDLENKLNSIIDLYFYNFFPFFLSQLDCSYDDFLQYIYDVGKDLEWFVDNEIQKIKTKNKFQNVTYTIGGTFILISCYKRSLLGSLSTFAIAFGSNYMISHHYQPDILLKDIIKNVKYSYYPFIWEKDLTCSSMKNYSITINPYENNFIDHNKKNKKEINKNMNDIRGYDELLDHQNDGEKAVLAQNEVTDDEEEVKERIDIQKLFENDFNDCQLIIFFEQNVTNDSSLLFKSLSGINDDFTNGKQMKISSSSVSIDRLLKRFKSNGKEYKSGFKRKFIKFIYLKGFGRSSIMELCLRCTVKPILVSSMKAEDVKLSIIPNDCNNFYLFYHSYEFFNDIFKARNNFTDKDHFLIDHTVNERNYSSYVNNDHVTELKNELGIPNGKILPINSDFYSYNDSGSTTHALIRLGCMSILQVIYPDENDS